MKKRIAILGGGIASLSTAFELTNAPNWSERYEITVYQMGWRLGGKGASGRNSDEHQRIEEHGLHVWPGFYDNAFRIMRQCYAELNRPTSAPINTWQQAFLPQDFIALEEKIGSEYKHWIYKAVRLPGLPGDERPTPNIIQFVTNMLEAVEDAIDAFSGEVGKEKDFSFSSSSLVPEEFRALIGTAASKPADLIEEIANLAKAIPENSLLSGALTGLLGLVLDYFQGWLKDGLDLLADASDLLRRIWIFVDMMKTNLRGMLADNVLLDGFDPLDNEDYRQWLRRHGASPKTIDSALVRGLYDFVFANVEGRSNLAAGAALRLNLRTAFGYQGAIMYKMQAGMGDIVFAPLYEVLKNRGVRFEFFQRVHSLLPNADHSSIDSIVIRRQATLVDDQYQPLVDVKNLPTWPNKPQFEQLVEGEQIMTENVNLESTWSGWKDVEELSLRVGEDFDLVVFGISLGAIPDICSRLVDAKPRWQSLSRIPTIATIAVQVWLKTDVNELGWPGSSPVLTAHEKPFETWADMSQTIVSEVWDDADVPPKNAAYLCGVVADPDVIPSTGTSSNFPESQRAATRLAFEGWLRDHAHPLWPELVSASGEVSWEIFVAPSDAHGVARLDSQYFEPISSPPTATFSLLQELWNFV